MSEEDLQDLILGACKAMGLVVYHTHDSRRSVKGFPDLVIVGAKGVLWRELKSESGKVSPEQHQWLTALQLAGQDATVWRPAHWPRPITGELAALGRSKASAPAPSQAQLRRMLSQRNGR